MHVIIPQIDYPVKRDEAFGSPVIQVSRFEYIGSPYRIDELRPSAHHTG